MCGVDVACFKLWPDFWQKQAKGEDLSSCQSNTSMNSNQRGEDGMIKVWACMADRGKLDSEIALDWSESPTTMWISPPDIFLSLPFDFFKLYFKSPEHLIVSVQYLLCLAEATNSYMQSSSSWDSQEQTFIGWVQLQTSLIRWHYKGKSCCVRSSCMNIEGFHYSSIVFSHSCSNSFLMQAMGEFWQISSGKFGLPEQQAQSNVYKVHFKLIWNTNSYTFPCFRSC